MIVPTSILRESGDTMTNQRHKNLVWTIAVIFLAYLTVRMAFSVADMVGIEPASQPASQVPVQQGNELDECRKVIKEELELLAFNTVVEGHTAIIQGDYVIIRDGTTNEVLASGEFLAGTRICHVFLIR
jgi:hypothetical protein